MYICKKLSVLCHFQTWRGELEIGHSELGRDSNLLINGHHHMRGLIEIVHLTKFDAFRMNRGQVVDLQTWFKIHTNVSNFETASPKTI